jgi:hypothetical protein
MHHSHDLVALNPQPLPPRWLEGLNPQPIPPEDLGRAVGRRLVDLAWTAEALGLPLSPAASDSDGDFVFCPVPFRPPITLPPGLYWPEPEPGPDYLKGYLIGLASSLAAASEQFPSSEYLRGTLEQSLLSYESVSESLPSGA